MDKLISTHRRLLKEILPSYERNFYNSFAMDERFKGIVGARGTGKTTFLIDFIRRNYGSDEKAIYISADNYYFLNNTLIDFVDEYVRNYDGKLFCIDEIHKYKNWNLELKNIYDSYPNIKVLFSGSSSIDLVKGRYDISRRVVLDQMYGFSFREYLEMKLNLNLPVLTLDNILKGDTTKLDNIADIPKILGYFKEYLKVGYYPFTAESRNEQNYYEKLNNLIDKAIYEDTSAFYSLNTQNLLTLKKIIFYFATSEQGKLNINKLANSIDKDNTTVAEYIEILKEVGLLRYLLSDKYANAYIRNAEKVYIDNSNLLYAINKGIGKEVIVGALREGFVLQCLQIAGHVPCYPTNGVGDCVVDDVIMEIGGQSKKNDQVKGEKNAFLVKDDMLNKISNEVPMYLLGFLY